MSCARIAADGTSLCKAHLVRAKPRCNMQADARSLKPQRPDQRVSLSGAKATRHSCPTVISSPETRTKKLRRSTNVMCNDSLIVDQSSLAGSGLVFTTARRIVIFEGETLAAREMPTTTERSKSGKDHPGLPAPKVGADRDSPTHRPRRTRRDTTSPAKMVGEEAFPTGKAGLIHSLLFRSDEGTGRFSAGNHHASDLSRKT